MQGHGGGSESGGALGSVHDGNIGSGVGKKVVVLEGLVTAMVVVLGGQEEGWVLAIHVQGVIEVRTLSC